MKRLKSNEVNVLSFVKIGTFEVNAFDVKLEKVVGNNSLTLTNLTDINNLDECKDFIRITVDLVSNPLDGGEYILTLTNNNIDYNFLTHIEDYTTTQDGSGIYGDSVKFTDL
jgi:hypothetical protein